MNLEQKQALKNLAKENNDVELAFVASGETDPFIYLTELVETDAGKASVAKSKRPISSIAKQNAKRYKQVKKWLNLEDDEKYKALYEQELAALEEYAFIAIIDLLDTKAQ